MFTDKLGGSELPHPQNIKIEENPKLFAIYAIPENEIKTIQVFVCYPMQEGCNAGEKAFLMNLKQVLAFLNNFGSSPSNFKTTIE